MQDMDDEDSSQQYLRSSKQEGQHNNHRNPRQTGFVVQGAPWEPQRGPVVAPNTASNEEFPSFGESAAANSSFSDVGTQPCPNHLMQPAQSRPLKSVSCEEQEGEKGLQMRYHAEEGGSK